MQNSDQDDHYAQNLGAGFREHYSDAGHTVVQPEETYIGGEFAANAMDRILRNICQQRPDVVFFAGRAPELAALVARVAGQRRGGVHGARPSGGLAGGTERLRPLRRPST